MAYPCSRAEVQRRCFTPALPGLKQTILILEDHVLVRAVIYETLVAQGYVAMAADDLPEAFALCRDFEFPIHLIVADMTGRDAADFRQLRSGLARYSEINVLLIVDPLDAEKEQGAGPRLYPSIEKPFTPTELVQTIEGLFNPQQTSPHHVARLEHHLHERI